MGSLGTKSSPPRLQPRILLVALISPPIYLSLHQNFPSSVISVNEFYSQTLFRDGRITIAAKAWAFWGDPQPWLGNEQQICACEGAELLLKR